MPKKPQILSSKMIASSECFHVQALEMQFANGERRRYERLKSRGHGSVIIVPMLDEDTVILVREYGAGLDDYFLGLPQGVVEAGETAMEAANRELMEEVGYGSNALSPLKKIAISPGYMTHLTDIVLAQELYENKLPGDEPEPLEVVTWPLSGLDELVKREEFCEPRSIAALFLARERLHGV